MFRYIILLTSVFFVFLHLNNYTDVNIIIHKIHSVLLVVSQKRPI